MIITYLGHSGFAVELADRLLVFDAVDASLPQTDKQKYIFVSHRHFDHFDRNLIKKTDGVTFLAFDCKKDCSHVLPQEGTLTVDGMTITTVPSNDEGVAIHVATAEGGIYHAGDLNDWDWPGEPQDWLSWQSSVYDKSLDALSKLDTDVAFVPLDPRLEHNGAKGIQKAVAKLNPKLTVAMHFAWNDTTIQQAVRLAAGLSFPVTIMTEKGDSLVWNSL